MKINDNDKFIIFRNKLYESETEISAIDDPFIESYDPTITSLKESLLSIFEEKVSSKKQKDEGYIETGLKTFDSYLGGLKNGELTLVGINSVYFSPVATIISSMLKEIHLPGRVGVISAKFTTEELITHFLSILTETPGRQIKNMILSEKDLKKVKTVCERIYDEPLFINDNLYPSLEEFKAAALKLKYENDVQLILIDSFECVGRELTFENSFEKQRRLTRFLKELAKVMDIPIVVISHFPNSTVNPEDYAASGISFAYADNIVFCDVQNKNSENNKLNGTIIVLKSKSGNISYSVKLNTETTGIEESFWREVLPVEKENKYEGIFLCVCIMGLMLFSFMCGFSICERTYMHRVQQTPKVMVIPKTNGNHKPNLSNNLTA